MYLGGADSELRLCCPAFIYALTLYCIAALFYGPCDNHNNKEPDFARRLTMTMSEALTMWIPSVDGMGQLLLACGLAVALVRFLLSMYALTPSDTRAEAGEKPSSEKPSSEKPQARPWGQWQPSPYTRPRAPPYPDFDLRTTKPLPYRPFRHGPHYFVNLGIRSMRMDDWIELDCEWPAFHAAKLARIAERGPRLCRTAPEARDAALELCEDLAAYLAERYPSMFAPLDPGGRRCGVRNLYTGEVFDLTARPLAEDPMQMAAKMVQDDLAVMVEKDDGQYYLLAGAIHLAGAWRLEDKFGMPLSSIHTSGHVPQFREKLEKGMINLFRRLKVDAPVLRNNYFIQPNGSLPWNVSLGSEDDHNEREKSWGGPEPAKSADELWFRSERQSLRRLPRSGAIVFTIRTYFHPVADIVKEPYVPGRLASGVRSWGDDVAKYKGREGYERVLLDFLDKKHEEQVANGLDMSKEDKARSYPW